jgi:predicted nucleotidyltransferase
MASGASLSSGQRPRHDFIVEFDAKSFDAYMDLKALLERLLGRRVDLVLRDALKPRLQQSVLNEALHAPGL